MSNKNINNEEFTIKDCYFQLLVQVNNKIHQVYIPQKYLINAINEYGKLSVNEEEIIGITFDKPIKKK